MSAFTLHLQSPTQYERIDGVESFVGEDASGAFGILAGHERLVTCLATGLARFRTTAETWRYVALPGGVAYFVAGELFVSTRHYIVGADYECVSRVLTEAFAAEEEKLAGIKESLKHLEEEMLRRIWAVQRERGL